MDHNDIMPKKIYVKSPKLYLKWDGINPYSHLSRNNSFKLESKCLKLLQKSYVCTCGHGHERPHFPRLIDRDKEALTISMNWVGETIYDLRRNGADINVPNPDAQIACIINNLNRAGVYHLDMHRSGKNLCIRKGTLSVIDFDIAVFQNADFSVRPATAILLAKLERYKKPTYNEHLYNLIRGILMGVN